MSNYQDIVIKTEAQHVVINSCAAAGKTASITGRVKYLVESGVEKNKIVVITFTTNAAAEMKDRLGDIGNGIFIGTIHSYANYLLLSSSISTKSLLDNEKFDELFEMVKLNPRCIQEVEHLLLDEAQDSDATQWEFILDYIKPKNWYFVGDVRQHIYSFLNCDSAFLINLMERDDVVVYDLPINYRNDKSILNFAKRLVKNQQYKDESIAASQDNGQVIETDYSNETIKRYINATVKTGSKYGDWFVLGRSNAQVDEIYNYLKEEGIPCDTFKRATLSTSQLAEKMNDNTVKVLTIHASKGLEADNVAVVGGLFYNEEERRVCYVAATRARHLLLWLNRPKKVKPKPKQRVYNWE